MVRVLIATNATKKEDHNSEHERMSWVGFFSSNKYTKFVLLIIGLVYMQT